MDQRGTNVIQVEHLVRRHRGGLAESMATVQVVRDRAHLVEVIRESLAPFGKNIEPDQISIEPYHFDARIGWNTYLICIEGYGVWGMSNGPI